MGEEDDLARWQNLAFGYVDPRGAPWLRTAIAGRHEQVSSDDVLCCAGAQEAVACVAGALLQPSDHAVVVLPIYQPSEQAVTGLCAATGVPLSYSDWQLDVDRVAASIRPNTKLILINFPNSPTGVGLDQQTLLALVDVCRRYGLWLVNDEVYAQSECDLARASVAPVVDSYERGISINGLSKGFGLPGLRVGWAVCREQAVLARALHAKSILSSCVSSASEILAHVALRSEPTITARTREIGRQNRRHLHSVLAAFPDLFGRDDAQTLAFGFPRYLGPDGADHFAARLVRDAGLMVLPSTLWRSPLGSVPGNHVRIGLGHRRNAEGLDAFQQFVAVRRAA
ncbi:pyridoxal phosphate-dependent aminotransferase [uncultured Enterovirga sp.]|uniref:pyridoxal phosphate-dependent aminotransferase n=1 Tax=uncultured Enterovirga sp. TaxID=2026352 RepID=UPI0035C9E01C